MNSNDQQGLNPGIPSAPEQALSKGTAAQAQKLGLTLDQIFRLNGLCL